MPSTTVELWTAIGPLGVADVYVGPASLAERAAALPVWGPFPPIQSGRTSGGRVYVAVPGTLTRDLEDLREGLPPAAIAAFAWHLTAALAEIHEHGGAHGCLHPSFVGLDARGRLAVRPALASPLPTEPDPGASAQATDCLQLGELLAVLGLERLDDPGIPLLRAGLGRDRARLRMSPARAARQALAALAARHPEWEAALVESLGASWRLGQAPRLNATERGSGVRIPNAMAPGGAGARVTLGNAKSENTIGATVRVDLDLAIEAPRPAPPREMATIRVATGPSPKKVAEEAASQRVAPQTRRPPEDPTPARRAAEEPPSARIAPPVRTTPDPAAAQLSPEEAPNPRFEARRAEVPSRPARAHGPVIELAFGGPPAPTSPTASASLPPATGVPQHNIVATPPIDLQASEPPTISLQSRISTPPGTSSLDPAPFTQPKVSAQPISQTPKVESDHPEDSAWVEEEEESGPTTSPAERVEDNERTSPADQDWMSRLDSPESGLPLGETVGEAGHSATLGADPTPLGEPGRGPLPSLPGVPAPDRIPGETATHLDSLHREHEDSDGAVPDLDFLEDEQPTGISALERLRVAMAGESTFDEPSSFSEPLPPDPGISQVFVRPVADASRYGLTMPAKSSLAANEPSLTVPEAPAKLPTPRPPPAPLAAATTHSTNEGEPKWEGIRGVSGEPRREAELGSGKWTESGRSIEQLQQELSHGPVREMEMVEESKGSWKLLLGALLVLGGLVLWYVLT